MPKGVQGFQKGHGLFPGAEKGCFKKGQIPHNKGKKYPELIKEKNGAWKGDDAKYIAKHMWISYHHGKANKCENKDCKYPRVNSAGRILLEEKTFNWANISGNYKREKDDWIMLCASCHQSWDRGLIEILGILK